MNDLVNEPIDVNAKHLSRPDLGFPRIEGLRTAAQCKCPQALGGLTTESLGQTTEKSRQVRLVSDRFQQFVECVDEDASPFSDSMLAGHHPATLGEQGSCLRTRGGRADVILEDRRRVR